MQITSVSLIGLAGGSGAGKSTLATALWRLFPDHIVLLHVDDYFQKAASVPLYEGFTNWDCPEAIDFAALEADVAALKAGKTVVRRSKSPAYNPNHLSVGKQEVVFEPRPLILLEGYLALHAPSLRAQMDFSLFLDVPHTTRIARRRSDAVAKDGYFERVLKPMHALYVEPTKATADKIIDAAGKTPQAVLSEALDALKSLLPKA